VLRKHIRFSFDKSPNSPSIREIFQLSRYCSKKEKQIVLTCGIVAIFTLFASIALASSTFLVTVPSEGGEFSEGILGKARFINPLLATSDTDKDLTALVFSGLLRAENSEEFIPDLAESYSISPDGISYTFLLKDNLRWQDGQALTSSDIIFTVRLVQDNLIKSPLRVNWDGVTVEAPDERTVRFILKQPYAPFLENTTMGILPEHLWKAVEPQAFALSGLNIKAIGSGPYMIKTVESDSSGIPHTINLIPNKYFSLGKPLIKKVTLRLYDNERDLVDAYSKHQVDSLSGFSTEGAEELESVGAEIYSKSLSRVFAVFLNANQSKILADVKVRKALELATPRNKIIAEALSGFASTEIGPLLGKEETGKDQSSRIEEAKTILASSKIKEFKITLSTSDSPELSRAAQIIADTWKEIGVDVTVKIYETSDLNTNVIRPRKFDALLFGEVVGHFPDPYAFWHSGERLDPGLNISGYTNPQVDHALSAARIESDKKLRADKYKIFEKALHEDIPAIFLYSPHFAYIKAKQISGNLPETISNSSDRFNQIYKWYIMTDKLWSIFTH